MGDQEEIEDMKRVMPFSELKLSSPLLNQSGAMLPERNWEIMQGIYPRSRISNPMSSWPWMAEQVDAFRTLRAPFLTFFAVLLVLLATPNPIAMLASGGSYSPLVSLFITGLRMGAVPPGWILISVTTNEPLEIYAVGAIMLALLLSSPIISYQILRFIAPTLAMRKRTLYSLVALASALLAVGALFGAFFLVDLYINSMFFYG